MAPAVKANVPLAHTLQAVAPVALDAVSRKAHFVHVLKGPGPCENDPGGQAVQFDDPLFAENVPLRQSVQLF